MSKEKNDSFVVIIFSILWIVRPIFYDEMRSRHPIYPQENVVVVNNSSISNQNDEFDFLESTTKEIILAKDSSASFFKKFGPGARAKADARRHSKVEGSGSGSTRIPGTNGFVPQSTYCRYHENAPLSCKPRVKVSDNPFQGDGNNPPPEDGSEFDFSQYKGGPSPFKNFDYDNENHTRENVAFSNQRRMNHSYDGHAEKCFDMQENRNKQSLQKFEKNIRDYIESPETERINGSYRYETPVYHYKKPDEDLIVTVNATNNEYISVRNATDFQLEKLEIDGNLGYDSRPSMSLKLRGPKQ